MNVKEQIIYCESPNAFGIPPKVFKRGSNYLFSGNGMFYITKQPLKNENNKKKSMKVHGIGKFHQVYSSIIDILNMKDKNVLDLGAGLGFISFYIFANSYLEAELELELKLEKSTSNGCGISARIFFSPSSAQRLNNVIIATQ